MSNDFVLAADTWDFVFGLTGNASEEKELCKWVDFAHVMALEKTKILCGKGFVFETEDEELKSFFEELNKDSHFFEEIQELCYWIFKNGEAVIGFDRLKDGEFKLYVPSGTRKVRLAKSYKQIIGASVYKVVQTSYALKAMIWERWNDETVERAYFFDRNRIPIDGLDARIPKNEILPEKEKSPFGGIIPFQDIPNYSFSNKPDSYSARHLIKSFNQMMDYYELEMKNNRSRILFNVPNKLKTDIKNGKIDELGYLISTQDEQAKVTSVPSTLLFQAIESALDSTMKRIYAISSSAFNSNQSGAGGDTTATELTYNNSSLVNSIVCSRTTFNSKMTIFLTKLFKAKFGIEKEFEFSFYLNENTAISEAELLQETKEKVMMGLTSKIEAISTLDNVDMETAEEKLDKINKEFDEMAEQQEALGGENNEQKKDPS